MPNRAFPEFFCPPGTPTRQRVLDAIRWYFRKHGGAPCHREIAELAGIAIKRVQSFVEQLAQLGYLTYAKRVRRSITLVDRGAMLSDQELRLANAGRGWTVIESAVPALVAAYSANVLDRDPDGHLLKRLT